MRPGWRPTPPTSGGRGAGLRGADLGLEGRLRCPFLDRLQAAGRASLRPLGGGRLGRRPGRPGRAPQPSPARRALGRQRADLLVDLRGRRRPRRFPKLEEAIVALPLCRLLPDLAGPELEHLRRLARPRGARAAADLAADRDRQGLPRAARWRRTRRAAPGLQISLGGLLGVAVGVKEGLELNLLGLVIGVDPLAARDQAAGPGAAGGELRRRMACLGGRMKERPMAPGHDQLNQLRVFWAVAHSDSLTRAAKQLGVTQPALSQQLAKLEHALGGQLFDRVNNQLVLTDAGRFLLRKAEIVLAEIDEAEAGLADYNMGRRRRISVGALASLARTIVPDAYRLALAASARPRARPARAGPRGGAGAALRPQPADRDPVAGLARRQPDLVHAGSSSRSDPYVFAVPRGLDLGCVIDPEWDLTAEQRRVLNRTIQFNFGNLHNQRIDEWYRRVLPRHQVAAWCRTYESALALVQAGLGVALVPQLCTQLGGRPAYDVDLHAVPGMERPIVALVPPQYRRAQPFAIFLECLQARAAADGPAAARAGAAVPRRRPTRRPKPRPRHKPWAMAAKSGQPDRRDATSPRPAPVAGSATQQGDDHDEEVLAGPEGRDDPGEHGSHDVPAGSGLSSCVEPPPAGHPAMRVRVLGAAAGGGFPQWNADSEACRRARRGDPAARPATQASIALSVDGQRWILVNASPDLRQQIEANPCLQPTRGLRSSPIAAVVLTNADVDAVAGLLHLARRHAVRASTPIARVLARARPQPDLRGGRTASSCRGGRWSPRRARDLAATPRACRWGSTVRPVSGTRQAAALSGGRRGDRARYGGDRTATRWGWRSRLGGRRMVYLANCARITDCRCASGSPAPTCCSWTARCGATTR